MTTLRDKLAKQIALILLSKVDDEYDYTIITNLIVDILELREAIELKELRDENLNTLAKPTREDLKKWDTEYQVNWDFPSEPKEDDK